MSVPKPTPFSTPTRSVSEFTVGNSDLKPDLSTAATSPTVGGITQNPQFIQTVAMTTQTTNVACPANPANTYVNVLPETPIDLPGLLPNNGSITFGPNDVVFVFAQGFLLALPAVINLATVIVTPYGITAKQIRIRGPVLPTNVEFHGFGVFVNIFATTGASAIAAGGVFRIRIDAMLLDSPG